MRHFLRLLLVILIFPVVCSAAKPAESSHNDNPSEQQNWYNNFIFKDDSFDFEFIRTLGYAYTGGADLGEGISTARAIKNGDTDSWYQQWLNTSDRLNTLAQQMEKNGDVISARELYLRASNYYRTAGIYMVAAENRPKSISAYAASKSSFLHAIASLSYVKPVAIPYEFKSLLLADARRPPFSKGVTTVVRQAPSAKEMTNLPGYFIRSKLKNAPLLIVHTGFDGTAEELYFEAAVAAHERGYNVLIFEGPGQGSVLREQHLPFRYDWEHVVTPVIDYAMTLPDVDKNKIALMGISMGGYLAARACAFDDRIKACIVNGGVYSQAESIYQALPPDLIALLKVNPQQFSADIYDEMRKHLTTRWFFNNAMWTFAAASPYEVIEKLKPYTLKNVIGRIKCPTLVIDSEADLFFKGQPQQVYAALTSPKTLLTFTRKETAQAHCQMGAIAISNEKILNWLDSTFQNESKSNKGN